MDLYSETKFLMKKYNITANKSLGQNFLIEEEVITDAITASDISKEDLVIEIGPGLGTLTKYLLEKAGKVLCVELDNNMIQVLQERFFLYDNFAILNADILKVDIKTLIQEEKAKGNIQKVKVVANLPYYITTPIIMKLLEEKLNIESITVMIQKEVADRLTAIPGSKNTGAITYSVYYYAQAEQIRKVPNTCFVPEPEVESEVIKLTIRKQPPIAVKNESLLFKVIKQSFMQRRKTLLNALSNSGLITKEEIKQILQEMEIDERVRAENLTIEQFAQITDKMEGR